MTGRTVRAVSDTKLASVSIQGLCFEILFDFYNDPYVKRYAKHVPLY